MNKTITIVSAMGMLSTVAMAGGGTVVTNYDDLAEGAYGNTLYHNGITYEQVNNVHGVFPDGSTFEPGGGIEGLGDTVIVENATLLYNDFPGFGSGPNGLTFGAAFIPGDNVSLGAISTVTMTLDEVADFASLEMAFYENGPWGGIVYHLDALMGGSVVASDSYTLSDLGGRDNIAFTTLSVDGAQFDSLNLYATFGDEYTGPRILMDNLTVNIVPAPSAMALLIGGGLLSARRRR